MRLIGIAGHAGSGKDTLADVLVARYGFTKIAFADTLKNVCSQVFDIPLDSFYDRVMKEEPYLEPIIISKQNIGTLVSYLEKNGIEIDKDVNNKLHETGVGKRITSNRNLMQFVGTELCRECIDDSIWLNIVKNNIELNKDQRFVISDCRLKNERDFIKSMNGSNILVKRPNIDILNPTFNHKSELDIGSECDYDTVFNNDSNLGTFQECVELWFFLKRV